MLCYEASDLGGRDVARANFVKQYADADAAGRVDIICKNYPIFLGIGDSSTDGLIYVIENENDIIKGINFFKGILPLIFSSNSWKALIKELYDIIESKEIDKDDVINL